MDRLFQAFGQPGCLDVGGSTEFRIRKADEDCGGTAFADYVWKPVVLIEMKKRGENLQKQHRRVLDCQTRAAPNRVGRPNALVFHDDRRVEVFDHRFNPETLANHRRDFLVHERTCGAFIVP